MKKINVLLSVFCLILFSCERDVMITQEDSNANLTTEITDTPFTKGPSNPVASCPPADDLLETRLQWTAYISGLAMYGEASIITELQTELSLNPSTKALLLNDLLGTSTNTPLFKQKFLQFAEDILDGASSIPFIGGGCPDLPAGGPDDDPNGGDFCSDCTPFSAFMDAILLDNCIELYFPRGVYSDLTVFINTTSHPLCNAYGNEGYSRIGCGSTVPLGTIIPNYVQTNEETFIVARPVVDLSNSNCIYADYNGLDLNFFLVGNWPLAQ
ncbi:MAG: hypothetical protein AAF489_02920 [Bacteroidota bacterium]